MNGVAVFHDLGDGAGRLRGIIHLHHRLMQVGIETLAQGLDPSNAETLKGLEQNAERRLHTFNKRGILPC